MSSTCVLLFPHECRYNTASQTELAINTHVIVSEVGQNLTSAHEMVADIHRTIVQGQEGSSSEHSPVGDSHTLAITERILIVQ